MATRTRRATRRIRVNATYRTIARIRAFSGAGPISPEGAFPSNAEFDL